MGVGRGGCCLGLYAGSGSIAANSVLKPETRGDVRASERPVSTFLISRLVHRLVISAKVIRPLGAYSSSEDAGFFRLALYFRHFLRSAQMPVAMKADPMTMTKVSVK